MKRRRRLRCAHEARVGPRNAGLAGIGGFDGDGQREQGAAEDKARNSAVHKLAISMAAHSMSLKAARIRLMLMTVN